MAVLAATVGPDGCLGGEQALLLAVQESERSKFEPGLLGLYEAVVIMVKVYEMFN